MLTFFGFLSRLCPPLRGLFVAYLHRRYSSRMDAAAARFFSMEDLANG